MDPRQEKQDTGSPSEWVGPGSGDPTDAQITTLSASSFIAAFVLHAFLAEVWIRLTRRTGLPRTHASKVA